MCASVSLRGSVYYAFLLITWFVFFALMYFGSRWFLGDRDEHATLRDVALELGFTADLLHRVYSGKEAGCEATITFPKSGDLSLKLVLPRGPHTPDLTITNTSFKNAVATGDRLFDDVLAVRSRDPARALAHLGDEPRHILRDLADLGRLELSEGNELTMYIPREHPVEADEIRWRFQKGARVLHLLQQVPEGHNLPVRDELDLEASPVEVTVAAQESD